MSNITRLFALCLSMSFGLALTACSDDPDGTPTNTTGTTPGASTPGATTPGGTNTDQTPACDPKGANPAMGALLNAPLAADVQVIKKTPTHPNPGNPGPGGLPQ